MFDMLNQRERPIWEALRAQNPYTPRLLRFRAAARRVVTRSSSTRQNTIFQKMYSGPGAPSEPAAANRACHASTAARRGQFFLLFSRYFKTKVRDVGARRSCWRQAPIIGLLLALVFGGQKEAIPYWCLGALQELGRRSGGLGSGSNEHLSSMQVTTRPLGRSPSSWSWRRCGSARAMPPARS